MYTLTAVKQLLQKNISVELLCAADSRIHIEANNIGLIIHPLKASGYVHPFGILKLFSILRRGKYDLVHTQASKDLWIIVPALKLLGRGIPLVMTKQVGSFIVKKDKLHRWLYNRVTAALAISSVIKKNLLDTCPLTEDKIKLLHNGIDTGKFNPEIAKGNEVREEFGIKKEELLIGMVARFSPGKGHEEFLTAAKILNEEYPGLKFIIVGEASRGEDNYAESIKKLAESYRLGNIIFAGYRIDTPNVLAAIDIFVFPSHAEAFGIALAEALSMGRPSVCSDSDGVLDIAVDGVTSLLFKNKNAEDLAAKLEILINNLSMREKFSAEARKRAVEMFDIKMLTDRVLDFYGEIIKK